MDENPKLVYIKRVDIKGFKTFQNKISLHLDKGLTAITGPNGSGKSNFMDAIKFALGELSPKELRGTSFEDVISKTSSDKSLKSAYVAIQFDNTDRRIPIDSDYITVSRQYAMGGEGIYRVNGRRVSRRQIHDALSSTGISVSGINMIPQGAVTRLAEATVDERRKIIEDVVGIGIFDEKKEESKTHLQHAEINIKVASAKVEEVRSRVESLEKERNDLVRSKFLKKEIRELQAKIVSQKIIGIEKELLKLLDETGSLKNLLNQTQNDKDRLLDEKQILDEEKIKFEEDKAKLTEELFKLERKIAEVTVDTARKNVELKETRKKIKDLEQAKEDIIIEKKELTVKIDEINKKLTKLKLDKKALTDKCQKLETERQSVLTKIEDNKNATTGLLAEIGKLDKHMSLYSEENMRIETSLNHERNKLEMLKSRIKEIELNSTKNTQQISSLKEKNGALVHEIDRKKKDLEKTRKKIKDKQVYLDSKKNTLKEAKNTFEKAKETKLRIQAEKRASKETDQGNKAYSTILRLIKAGKIHGIKGRISSLIRIKTGFKRILELASEGWLNAVLAEDLDAAISCTEVLRNKKFGRLKIIPLSRINTTKPIVLDLSDKDLVGRAVDLIECSEEIRPAINFVLGDTVVVKTRTSALIMSLNGYRAVTLDGDVFDPKGLIEAGYREDLYLWEEIDDYEIKNLEKLMSDLYQLMILGEEEVSRLDKEISELQRIEFQTDNNFLNLQHEIENLNKKISQKQAINSDYISLKDKLNRELLKQKEEISELRNQKSIEEKKLRELYSKKKSLMHRMKQNGVESWEKNVSNMSIQLDNLRTKIHEIDKTLAVSTSEMEYAFERIGELQKSFNETEEEIEQGKSIVDKLHNKMNTISKEANQLESEKKSVTEINLNMDRRRGSIESKLRKVDEELKRVFRLINENSLTFTQLREQIKEREIEKSFLLRDLKNLDFEAPINFDDVDIEHRQEIITLFNRELDEIGAVNELAEEQYNEYMGNYKQLSSKINELEEEKIEILRVMSDLEQEKRKVFLEAFKRVEKNFSDIFSRITNGGSGKLTLENEEDPFSGGIEVKLKFPGKREFSISGASGGEKSVATVCFIIAMQAIQPMPFYFFDEIDAHLDPVNSQRLIDLLKERSKGCQFIIISLKDITISRADKVCGTFIEKGASKLISLPMPEMAIKNGR